MPRGKKVNYFVILLIINHNNDIDNLLICLIKSSVLWVIQIYKLEMKLIVCFVGSYFRPKTNEGIVPKVDVFEIQSGRHQEIQA